MRLRTAERRLLALQLVTLVVGLVAIGIAVVAISVQVNDIQRSRQRAATDTCYLLRVLVLAASPKRELHRAEAFINETPLRNCLVYGRTIGITTK